MNQEKQCGGRRRQLVTKLEEIEFYCLTCRNKRKIRSPKNIQIKTTKNNRPYVQAKCNASDCTRKLTKFISNDQQKVLQDMAKNKVPISKIAKKKIAKK
jgi:hypothetical protein